MLNPIGGENLRGPVLDDHQGTAVLLVVVQDLRYDLLVGIQYQRELRVITDDEELSPLEKSRPPHREFKELGMRPSMPPAALPKIGED